MFIRWQGSGARQYAHLEERKRVGGKVVTKYVKYLGVEPRAKLLDLLIDGVISQGDYERLTAGLPEPVKPEPLTILEQLKAELDRLTERGIMSEFTQLSDYTSRIDGVRYVLAKLEGIKAKFPEVWGDSGPLKG
ncbi:MAG: hypothetical protein FWC60_12410 [Firmicutes bacterium]|nr:hypothetical protein [Bacillota bacterium]